MNIPTLNQLILDHLRFYGYQLAARIVESEFKTKTPKDQPRPSKLYEILLKFVELYGKPDLWGADVSPLNASDSEDRKVNLPRMDRAPFKGVHGNKSESYGGPFTQNKDNYEPQKVAHNTVRADAMGRGTLGSAGLKSTQMGMAGNRNEIGPLGPSMKGNMNPSSHLTSITNALRDKSPPGAGVSLYQDPNVIDMKRMGAGNNKMNPTYVGPYAIGGQNQNQNQSFSREAERSIDERDYSGGPVGYNIQGKQIREKQGRSTSVPQSESGMQESFMKERSMYGRRGNNARNESFIEDSEASTMDADSNYMSNPAMERVGRNPRNNYEGERVTFKRGGRDTEDQFGRIERPIRGNVEEREEQRRDWKAASEKKAPGNSMTNDYSTFVSRRGSFGRGNGETSDEKSFNSGVRGNQARGNLPPTFRVDSESSLGIDREPTSSFVREMNPGRPPGPYGTPGGKGREEYKEGGKVYFSGKEPALNPFESIQKNVSMIDRSPKFVQEEFGRVQQGEGQYGGRGGNQGYSEEKYASGGNRSFGDMGTSELDGQMMAYLKRDTKLPEGEIKRLFGIYSGLDGRLGYEGGLEKSKFIEFLKRAKGIETRTFADNLFKFGSQMGILSGMPPKIGFEEALIVQNNLSQNNPTELMKFLFMVSSGGSRETRLGLIETMLKELKHGDNGGIIGLLLESLEYIYAEGRRNREEMVSLDGYWGMITDFEPLRRHF